MVSLLLQKTPRLGVAAAEKTWNTFETGDSVIRAGMFRKAAGNLTAVITGEVFFVVRRRCRELLS